MLETMSLTLKLFIFFLVICIKTKYATRIDAYLSSLTKYEDVRGDIREIDLREDKCEPVNLWIIHRHGTRYPSIDEITAMRTLLSVKKRAIANHKNGKGSLSEGEIQRLREWAFDPLMEQINMDLTDEGWNETVRTARRFKEKFPKLLGKKYSPKDFYFKHSEKQRTLHTFYAFVSALFGEDAVSTVENNFVPLPEDFLLMPYAIACEKLAIIHSAYPYGFPTANEFIKTEEYQRALKVISNRLGFAKPLAAGNLTAMFAACGYDSAWYQESTPIGPWCSVLGEEGRSIGEYYWDLAFQDIGGYTNEVGVRSGCSPMEDLWKRFGATAGDLDAENKTQPAVVLFSHDSHLVAMFAALGVFKDDPVLSADNFGVQQNRLWRTREIVPFASNVAAVLQNCRNGSGSSRYEVTFLINEKPFNGIPGCPNGVCSWSNFKRLVVPLAENCNFDEFC